MTLALFPTDPMPRARRTDPRTSADAARGQFKKNATTLQSILFAFAAWGPMTDDEMLSHLRGKESTLKTARSRLSGRGLLVDSGETRPSNAGVAMIVWRLPLNASGQEK